MEIQKRSIAATNRDGASTMSLTPPSDAVAPSASRDPQGLCQFRLNILEAQLVRARPCNDQEVMGWLQLGSV